MLYIVHRIQDNTTFTAPIGTSTRSKPPIFTPACVCHLVPLSLRENAGTKFFTLKSCCIYKGTIGTKKHIYRKTPYVKIFSRNSLVKNIFTQFGVLLLILSPKNEQQKLPVLVNYFGRSIKYLGCINVRSAYCNNV